MGILEGLAVAFFCSLATIYGYVLGINQVRRHSSSLYKEYSHQIQSKNEEIENLIFELDRLKKEQKTRLGMD
jgi:hypothetical protein